MNPSNFAAFCNARVLLAAIGCAFAINVSAGDAHEFSVGNMSIAHPWARATAPVARTGVVYFSLKNSDIASRRVAASPSSMIKRPPCHRKPKGACPRLNLSMLPSYAGLRLQIKSRFQSGQPSPPQGFFVAPSSAELSTAPTLTHRVTI